MRRLTFGMNVSLDGFVAAPDGDLGWSTPSDELFRWWSDRVGATGTALYGRRMWQDLNSHWPTAHQRPGTTEDELEFARRWRDLPKVVFSTTLREVDGNARLVTGDAIAEITRLKADVGADLAIAGPTLAAGAVRAGLVDEYAVVRHPVVLGAGLPFLPALPAPVDLTVVETRTFPGGVVLTRYETVR